MNARATPAHISSTAPLARSTRRASWAPLGLALLLSLGLLGCGKEEEAAAPAPADGTDTAPTTIAEPAPAVPVDPNETPAQIAARADAAVDAQRLFAPPGDNAFELYLRVIEAEPDQPLARNALTDLFPYAVMHVEQRLGANDPDDAERVLVLMEKANPQAPALPRLKDAVTEARTRAAAAALAETQRAEREAAAAAQAAQQAAQAAAAPPPPPRQVAVATPPPVQTQPVAEPPKPEPEAVPAAPVRRPGTLPPVASQVQPRYPPMAFRRKVEGYVEVQFTVLADGSVSDVSVVRSEPRAMFDREAISAMQKWKFQAVPGAEPVKGRRVFDFKIQ